MAAVDIEASLPKTLCVNVLYYSTHSAESEIFTGFDIFSLLFANYWVQEAVNKLAASAAPLDYVNFQAVIKSAASAAFRKPRIQGSTRATARLADDGCAALPWIF